jgi:hypothetical protein
VCESKLRRSHAASDATPNLSWRRCLDRSYAKVYPWKQPLVWEDVTWVRLDKITESAMHGLVRSTSRKFYSFFLSTSNPLVYEARPLVALRQTNHACLVARLTLRFYHPGIFHIRHALVPVYGLNLCGSRGKAVACRMFGNPRKNCTMRFSPSPPPACGLQPCLNALM